MEARGARVTGVRVEGITTDYTEYTDILLRASWRAGAIAARGGKQLHPLKSSVNKKLVLRPFPLGTEERGGQKRRQVVNCAYENKRRNNGFGKAASSIADPDKRAVGAGFGQFARRRANSIAL